jgi:hypothetical protein
MKKWRLFNPQYGGESGGEVCIPVAYDQQHMYLLASDTPGIYMV